MKFLRFFLIMLAFLTVGNVTATEFMAAHIPVYAPGDSADVLIKVDLPSNATAFQFTLTLPETFKLVMEDLVLNTSQVEKLQTRVNKESDDKFNYVIYTMDNTSIDTSGDFLFGLRLEAKQTSRGGEYQLRLSDIIIATAEGIETRVPDWNLPLQIKISVMNITVVPMTASLKVGDSIILNTEIYPNDATDQTVTWISSDETVAVVDDYGKVTAYSLGFTTITAICEEVSSSCSVTVVPTPAEEIILTQTKAQLKVGESVVLTATVFPDDTTYMTLIWASDNTNVATVDMSGIVTAVSIGSATITATCGEASACCVVSVVPTPAESITISQPTASLKVGETVPLSATVLPEDATDKTVVWTSDDASVAIVDEFGTVTALSLGSATITARCGEVSASCLVSVVPTPAESIAVSQSTASLKVGETLPLSATVLPEDATDKTVVWTSDDASVAIIDEFGTVTALSLGSATITARCSEVSASCLVSVVPTPAESIAVSQSTASLKVGETLTLSATVFPEDATDKTIIWTSDNIAVATVDENGSVTAISLGSATITASCGDVKVSCFVTVSSIPVENIVLSQETAILKLGESVTLVATVFPENATDKTIMWSSDNESVAKVFQDGEVIPGQRCSSVAEG